MLKRISSMTLQSLILSFRNSLVWVLFGTLVVMILVVQFALPKESGALQTQYVYDGTEGIVYKTMMQASGIDEKYLLENEAELEQRVKSENGAVGIKFSGKTEAPEITLIYQGMLSEQNINIIRASLGKMVSAVTAGASGMEAEVDASGPEVRFLRERIEPVPKNLSFVSVLMVFEVLILGFLMIAVFIFQEKHDGSIRAYRITPGDTFVYIVSKVLAFLVIGIVYGFMLVGFTIGLKINLLLLLVVTVIGFILYTLIGMVIAVFFKDISEWFFIGIAALFINMAPAFSHEFPSFSPVWVTWFPSYQILHCIDEIFFPSGRSLFVPILILAAEAAAVYVVCHAAVNRKLMKEGK